MYIKPAIAMQGMNAVSALLISIEPMPFINKNMAPAIADKASIPAITVLNFIFLITSKNPAKPSISKSKANITGISVRTDFKFGFVLLRAFITRNTAPTRPANAINDLINAPNDTNFIATASTIKPAISASKAITTGSNARTDVIFGFILPTIAIRANTANTQKPNAMIDFTNVPNDISFIAIANTTKPRISALNATTTGSSARTDVILGFILPTIAIRANTANTQKPNAMIDFINVPNDISFIAIANTTKPRINASNATTTGNSASTEVTLGRILPTIVSNAITDITNEARAIIDFARSCHVIAFIANAKAIKPTINRSNATITGNSARTEVTLGRILPTIFNKTKTERTRAPRAIIDFARSCHVIAFIANAKAIKPTINRSNATITGNSARTEVTLGRILPTIFNKTKTERTRAPRAIIDFARSCHVIAFIANAKAIKPTIKRSNATITGNNASTDVTFGLILPIIAIRANTASTQNPNAIMDLTNVPNEIYFIAIAKAIKPTIKRSNATMTGNNASTEVTLGLILPTIAIRENTASTQSPNAIIDLTSVPNDMSFIAIDNTTNPTINRSNAMTTGINASIEVILGLILPTILSNIKTARTNVPKAIIDFAKSCHVIAFIANAKAIKPTINKSNAITTGISPNTAAMFGLTLSIVFMKSPSISIAAPRPTSPFIKEPKSIRPSIRTIWARLLIADTIIIIEVPITVNFFGSFITLSILTKKPTKTPMITTRPTSPFAKPPQSSVANKRTTPAKSEIEFTNGPSAFIVSDKPLASFTAYFKANTRPTITPMIIINAPTPTAAFSIGIVLNIYTAPAISAIDADNSNIAVAIV